MLCGLFLCRYLYSSNTNSSQYSSFHAWVQQTCRIMWCRTDTLIWVDSTAIQSFKARGRGDTVSMCHHRLSMSSLCRSTQLKILKSLDKNEDFLELGRADLRSCALVSSKSSSFFFCCSSVIWSQMSVLTHRDPGRVMLARVQVIQRQRGQDTVRTTPSRLDSFSRQTAQKVWLQCRTRGIRSLREYS